MIAAGFQHRKTSDLDMFVEDQVHLLDMISLGMIDELWLWKYPQNLSLRLEELVNDPDG